MLISLTSNHPELFRPIIFKKDRLNIILATKSKGVDDKGSRNGLGKSTFVNLICYCLGMNVDLNEEIPKEDLPGWTFTLALEIRGRSISVTRGLDAPDDITVTGDLTGCPNLPQADMVLENGYRFKEKEWRQALCWLFFGLQPADFASEQQRTQPPEYQSLISHFIRRYFDDPVRVNRMEANVKAEMAITFLLGLDWQYLATAKELRSRDKEAEVRISAANSRMKEWKRKRESLESECRILEGKIKEAEKGLATFNTIPHAQLVEDSVEKLTEQINRLDRKIARNRRLLNSAEGSKLIKYVSFDPVVGFYNELGVTFTEKARHTLEQVADFHNSLTINREGFLQEQIDSIKTRMERDEKIREELVKRRQHAMVATEANNAFKDYVERTKSLESMKQDLIVKQDCLRQVSNGEAEKDLIAQERQKLVDQAKEAHEKLRPVWEAENEYFASLIKDLYGITDATLGITVKNKDGDCGISYKPTFPTDRSLGKKKLKAFAFDMTIFEHQKVEESGIDFMVHDSVLYESSDSRQYAKALKLVAELCEKRHLQYIGVMNSDDVDTDDFRNQMSKEEIDSYVIHRLSDDPSGKETLFGFFFPVVDENEKEEKKVDAENKS